MRGVFYFVGDATVVDEALDIAKVVAVAVGTCDSTTKVSKCTGKEGENGTSLLFLRRFWLDRCCLKNGFVKLLWRQHFSADERRTWGVRYFRCAGEVGVGIRRTGCSNCGTDLEFHDV